MSWLPGANPAKVMSSIIRRRNGVIVISLRSKIGRGPPTQPREEILSTVQISDAALTLGEAVSPTPGNVASKLAKISETYFVSNTYNPSWDAFLTPRQGILAGFLTPGPGTRSARKHWKNSGGSSSSLTRCGRASAIVKGRICHGIVTNMATKDP